MSNTEKQGLEKFRPEPEYAAKIEVAKKAYKKLKGIAALGAEFFELKKRKAAVEKRLSEFNLQIAAIEALLLDTLEDEEITNAKFDDGSMIFKKSTAYPVVEDKKALFDWIKKTKSVSMLSVNHQTLKGRVNELLKDGEPLPGGVKAFLKDSIGHRGGLGDD